MKSKISVILSFLALFVCGESNASFHVAGKPVPFEIASKDTMKGMVIYDESNDSVIYDPNKTHADLKNNPNALKQEKENLAQLDKFQKKLKAAEKANNKKEIGVLLDSLATYYSKIKNYDEALQYLNKSIKLKEESGDRRSVAKIMNSIATVSFNAGKYDESINAYKKAINIKEELKEKEDEATLLKELAKVYQYTYQVDEAIKASEKSMKIKKELNDQRGVTTLINDIGNIYFDNQNFDKAINYYEQNLEIEKKLKDQSNIAASLNNIGIAYLTKGDKVRAENSFQKALELYKELKDNEGISATLNNLANYYFAQNQINKALENYENSIKLKAELKDEMGLAILKHNIGNIYKNKKDYKNAMRYLQESWNISKKNNYLDIQANNLYSLSQVYSMIPDYKNAYEFFKKYIDAKNILKAEDKETQLWELQEKYKQDKEITRLNKKITKQDLLSRITNERNRQALKIRDLELNKKEEEVKKQRIFNIFTGVVLLITSIFSFMLYRQFKKLQKANKLLWKQKNEIETKKRQLEDVNIELEKLSIVASETDNGVVIMSKDGDFEWINEGFTRLYGFTLETLKSMRGPNLIRTSANPNVKIAVMSCIKQKTSVRYETNFADIHGNKIWSQTTLTPIIDNKGNITKLVAIDSDITRIKNAEEEILIQKDQLEKQRDEIKKQRDIATRQRDEISHQKEEITDGIIYAEHIQAAILPPEDYIKERLPNHFILYLPRDIVSGDFYWVKRIENQVVFSAADCTGHGVPAALMSMLGSALLSEILNTYIKSDRSDNIALNAGDILNQLREQIIKSLHQTGKIGGSNDGIDMSLCILDTTTNVLQYAGANSPLYLVPANLDAKSRSFPTAVPFEDDLAGFEFKPDKLPIGIHLLVQQKLFTNHKIQLIKGDTIYLFSDGYADQFGGPKYNKFRYSKLKKLVVECNHETMEGQMKILENVHRKWRGNMEQIDDILVFGVRL